MTTCPSECAVIVIGWRHALVESKSTPGEWHAVEWDKKWRCTCPGYTFTKTCWHTLALAEAWPVEKE